MCVGVSACVWVCPCTTHPDPASAVYLCVYVSVCAHAFKALDKQTHNSAKLCALLGCCMCVCACVSSLSPLLYVCTGTGCEPGCYPHRVTHYQVQAAFKYLAGERSHTRTYPLLYCSRVCLGLTLFHIVQRLHLCLVLSTRLWSCLGLPFDTGKCVPCFRLHRWSLAYRLITTWLHQGNQPPLHAPSSTQGGGSAGAGHEWVGDAIPQVALDEGVKQTHTHTQTHTQRERERRSRARTRTPRTYRCRPASVLHVKMARL